jgi:glycerol-3-phosphate dehydrogenase
VELHLYQRFGTERHEILAMMEKDPTLATTAIDGLPYTRAELLYSAEREMATSLTDILSRRCRAHIQDARATLAAAPAIARLIAPVMGWSADDVTREVAAFQSLVESEFSHAGLRL